MTCQMPRRAGQWAPLGAHSTNSPPGTSAWTSGWTRTTSAPWSACASACWSTSGGSTARSWQSASERHRGVTKFERHCAENDIDIPFEFVSQLYKNPHDMSVLGDNNKLKLMARCIIMEAVDEQYSRTYAECTELAQELARTGISDIIPEGAEKMAGTIKSLIPMPAFLKKLF
ncbi:hypothetical protein COO60DRAFT_1089354 [Scenedesmus sp. NREL 46B-D3]|nr:hypothetical protein COO60DRAFT_1089354 [Scenedesmus sp. NREL 46B-D3]